MRALTRQEITQMRFVPFIHRFVFIVAISCVAAFSCFLTIAHAGIQPPWEAGLSKGEDLDVEIYTFGPGPSLEEWWGHIGLKFRDNRLKYEIMYNWGMFSFDEQLIRNFITGRLRFWIGAEPVLPTVSFYRRQGRVIHAIPLQLTPEQKIKLAGIVATNMRPENREYDYEYIRDNCSTRIRDLVNILQDGTLAKTAKGQKGKDTFRGHINKVTANSLGMNLLINFLLGPSVDAHNSRWDDMFLPGELEEYFVEQQTKLFDKKGSASITGPVRVINQGKLDYPKFPILYFPWDIGASLLISLAIILNTSLRTKLPRTAKALLVLETRIVAFVLGSVGTFLLFFNLFTWHTYTFWNENLFFGNPLTLALVPLAIVSLSKNLWAQKWTYRTLTLLCGLALVGVLFKTLPISTQDNWIFVRTIFPILFATLWSWRKQKE